LVQISSTSSVWSKQEAIRIIIRQILDALMFVNVNGKERKMAVEAISPLAFDMGQGKSSIL
jgi:hypothetical protein